MKSPLLLLASLSALTAFAETAQQPPPSASQATPEASTAALAPAATPLPPPNVDFPDQSPVNLDAKEKAAVEIASEWKSAPNMPAPGVDGKVMFTFGATLPSVVCSPLQVTDIELEPGETVKDGGLHIGDPVRWNVSPAVSGPEGAIVTHLVVKPTTPGISTSLLVSTDRRVYHVKLVASEKDWMPYVAFAYPENSRLAWAVYQKRVEKARSESLVADTGHTLPELDFAYTIEGRAPWTPVRVYNDGVKTIVQMPKAMAQTEAPALLVIGADSKEQLVNFRVHGDKYIVDQIFAKAELISGVGKKQVKVLITHDGPAIASNDDGPSMHHR